VPLLPGGPTLPVNPVSRPIDQLLSLLSASKFSQCLEQPQQHQHQQEEQEDESTEKTTIEESSSSWPFIEEDDIHVEDWRSWRSEEKYDAVVHVDFGTWIQGLPTVLLDIRPCALLVNLCGLDLHFSHSLDGEQHTVWKQFTLPHQGVFSPSNISWDKVISKILNSDVTINNY
jgi:hypothetical protein